MITLAEYKTILQKLKKDGFISQPILSIENGNTKGIFLKHDVECKIERAVQMAQIEKDSGHVATYYFQADFLETDKGLRGMQKIGEMGHEVGYHYDVLDENDGDFEKAQRQFDKFIRAFSALGYPIETVCPHGNPTKIRSGWKSNKDFFKSEQIRKEFDNIFDIVVDLESVIPNSIYISDAGYQLRIINDIGGNDSSNTTAMNDGHPILWSELQAHLERNETIILSLHPHRFASTMVQAKFRRMTFKIVKKAYALLRKIPGVSIVLNKYYNLARRI